MLGKQIVIYCCGICFVLLPVGCKNKPVTSSASTIVPDSFPPAETTRVTKNFSSRSGIIKKPVSDAIVGDTIRMGSYSSFQWYDTISTPEYTAYLSTRVDTNDYIIDTVKSSKGKRIAEGFNHLYNINFKRDNKNWFSFSFDKKRDMGAILDATDAWLESNLNIFENLLYNKKYDQFIAELNIDNRSGLGLLYYLVFDTSGEKIYFGTINSWGGESPDGEAFLTENGDMFVTCSEVYNFQSSSAMSLSEYVSMAEFLTKKESLSKFIQIHALRNLTNNHFLVIFNRFHDEPTYNAFILSTDTTVISRFSYYGIIEEMDAVLLYAVDPRLQRSFLYDTDREKLICIKTTKNLQVRELGIKDMREFRYDSSASQKYTQLDFNLYGSYEFFVSSTDSTIYYKADKFN
jgi:hypothetical protein